MSFQCADSLSSHVENRNEFDTSYGPIKACLITILSRPEHEKLSAYNKPLSIAIKEVKIIRDSNWFLQNCIQSSFIPRVFLIWSNYLRMFGWKLYRHWWLRNYLWRRNVENYAIQSPFVLAASMEFQYKLWNVPEFF